jgi:uncharacterized protein (DUF927 family)
MRMKPAYREIPEELRALPNWVAWRLEKRAGTRGIVRETKVPYNVKSGKHALSNNPATWGGFGDAAAALKRDRSYAGLGFCLTPPYVGVDLDGCRQNGSFEPWAQQIIRELDSYAEFSPSELGVHVITKGELPDGPRQKDLGGEHHGVGLYDSARGRYLTMTGCRIRGGGQAIAERTAELCRIHARLFPPKQTDKTPIAKAEAGSISDDDLIARARAAKDGGKFARLWDGQWEGSYGSQSEADIALCMKLAFWTGRDTARIDALFRGSGLMRAKWNRDDYRERTIEEACARQTETLHASARQGGTDSPSRNPYFAVTDRGVFHQDGTLVCSPLLVTAYARNSDSQCWGRLLEWKDDDGQPHSWNMPMELLSGEGAELRGVLLGGGVTISHKARNLLPWYIQSERPERRVIAADHLGWHNRTFVFPDSSIPEDASEPVLYQSPGRTQHFYHVRGSLEEWRHTIGRRCAKNSRLVFSVSCAFAGPLLRPLGAEGGGFHLVGLSSTGKSTTQWVAGSVCGGGLDGQSFKRTWRSTQNALEATAEQHNDSCLLLDELREIGDARELDSTIYMLANGAGRSRMTKAITLRRTLSWRLLFLSTGEVTLNEHVATAGGKTKGGAAVRLLNIQADAKAGLGAFECLHDAESPRVFAEDLRDAATRTFGSPLREFIRRFSLDWDNELEQAKRDVAEFVRKFCPPGASAEVGRALGRFALVAAAGEMATRFGITGWKTSEARAAALRCFKDWVEDRGGVGQADVEAGVRQVRAFIASKGSSRFQSIVQEFDLRGNELRERIHERAGFWKEEGEGEHRERFYLIFTDVFTDEVCSGFNAQMVLEELEKRKLLVKGDGRNFAKRETVPHEGRLRFYVIRAAILGT